MDGASADKEVIIDLNKYLPENVELADSNSKIHVTLKVEPLARSRSVFSGVRWM